jgi:nitroreductase
MDFMHVVEQRRAVRQYHPAPIERRLIERIINTAALAPSAMNLQPWAFAVVTGVTRIDEYARRAKEHLIADPDALELPAQARNMLNDPVVWRLRRSCLRPAMRASERAGSASADPGSIFPRRKRNWEFRSTITSSRQS